MSAEGEVLKAESCMICVERNRECDRKVPRCEQCARWGEPCDPHQDLYFAWDRSQRQNRPNIDPGLPAEDLLRAYKEAETARLELNLAEAKIHRPDPAVADRHQDVIDGMTRIYDTLIAMGYLAESNSRRSPHDEVPVAFQQLRSVGFDKDVIELLLHMPYISESHGNLLDSYELAPDTLSMSYLSNSMNDLGAIRDPLETGYNDIAPWDVRLTEGASFGTHLIYHSKTRENHSLERFEEYFLS